MDDQLRDELAKLGEEMSSLQGRLQDLQRRLHLLELQARTRASAAAPPPPPLPHERAAAAVQPPPLETPVEPAPQRPVEAPLPEAPAEQPAAYVQCPKCNRVLMVPEGLAGTAVRCRVCGTPFHIPAPAEAVAPAEQAPVEAAPAPETAEEPVAEETLVAEPKPAPEPIAPPKEPRPTVSFEQRVGVKWLPRIGIVILIIGSIFFFQYAVQEGWIGKPTRVVLGVLAGGVLLGLGEWTLRKRWRIFAAAVTGGGVGVLYLSVYAASPQLYKLISTEWAFGCMCAVTVLCVALSLRSDMIATTILAQIGAYLTPLLLSRGHNEQVALMVYLLAIGAGFLLLAALRRWHAVALIVLAGTPIVFALWFARYYDHAGSPVWRTNAFAWGLLLEFLVYAAAARKHDAPRELTGMIVNGLAGALMMVLFAFQRDRLSANALLGQLVVLDIVLLALAGAKRWFWMSLMWAAGTVLLFGMTFEAGQWLNTCALAWTFLAVFLAFAVSLPRGEQTDRLSIGLIAAGGLLMMLVLGILHDNNMSPAAALGQLLVLDALLLGIAAWRRWGWQALLWLAATIVLFAVVGRAARDVQALGFGWAVLGVFVAYAVAASALRRARKDVVMALVAGAGAAMMVLFGWRGQGLAPASLYGQLLALNVVLLALAAWRRWAWQPLLWVLGSAVLVGLSFERYAWFDVSVATWALFGLFLLYALAMSVRRRFHEHYNVALAAAAAALMPLLWIGMLDDMSRAETLGHLLALDVIILAVCLWRRWNWLRAGALAWTAVTFVLTWGRDPAQDAQATRELYAVFCWALAGLFIADVLIRAWWRDRRTDERLDAGLATAVTGMMFGATYALLRVDHQEWMGSYTAALAVAAIVLAWVLRRLAGRRTLGYGYLGQGLVLLTLVAPIQFDKTSVTIAWGAQAVVTMFLARRLGSRTLLAKSPIVLLLAVIHFIAIDMRMVEGITDAAFHVGGVGISPQLMLAAGLVVAILGTVAILRGGRAVWSEPEERLGAGLFVWIAAILLAWQTCSQLPAIAATWWWLTLAVGAAAVGLWRRSDWLACSGGAMLVAVAAKFLVYDTLSRRIGGPGGAPDAIRWPAASGDTLGAVPDAGFMLVLNWQLAAGVVLAAAIVLFVRFLRRALDESRQRRVVAAVAALVAAFVLMWAGSFEVDRYFANADPRRFENVVNARDMGFSIWWAVYAAALLVVGFIARRPPIRYMALAIFAVTLGKVLLVDMAQVDLVYRIGSFLALGALLLAASVLYQRVFQRAVASWDEGRADE